MRPYYLSGAGTSASIFAASQSIHPKGLPIDTAIDGLNQTQQQSSTPAQVQSVGGSSQFYKFYCSGLRLGHYQLSDKKSVAPSQLSLLDVAIGRIGDLASLLCPNAQYLGSNSCGSASTATTPRFSHGNVIGA